MRGSGGMRVLAVAMLAALPSSSVAGWAVAFHLAEPDHHTRPAQHRDGIAGLELALHGHAHEQGTPAHGHPLLTGGPARIPGKQILVIPAVLADAAELPAVGRGFRPLVSGGPTHDPPPRPASRPVLRI